MADLHAATEDEGQATGFFGFNKRTEEYSVVILRNVERRNYERTKAYDDRRCFEVKSYTPQGILKQLHRLGWDVVDASVGLLCHAKD